MGEQIVHRNNDFNKIMAIIEESRTRAIKAVNAELIRMYWEVGEYLSGLCANAAFGDKVIDEVASFIAESGTNVKGFNRRGLYRMKQFYETYRGDEFVSALLTQISWTNHLQILSGTKSIEERHFYLQLCAKNSIPRGNWSVKSTVHIMNGICCPPKSPCRRTPHRMCVAAF